MKKNLPTLEKLMKSYLGFLQGTGKAFLTVSSYRGDLEVFKNFLMKYSLDFYEIKARDFAIYEQFLRNEGMRTNTRRRKLITAKALYRYAFTRKYITSSPAKFLKTPQRHERLPWIPKIEDVEKILEFIPTTTEIGRRNRIIVQLLAETGMTVSEICALRWQDFEEKRVHILGKRARILLLSSELCERLCAWQKECKTEHLFAGYNRHGSSSQKITSRGVEILFRHLAKKLHYAKLHPKTMRHFMICEAIRNNTPDKEICVKIGVRANYSLQEYKKRLQHV